MLNTFRPKKQPPPDWLPAASPTVYKGARRIAMNSHVDFEKAITLLSEYNKTIQREFGHVFSGKNLVANQVNYPAHPEETIKVRKGVKSLIEGSLLIYLFTIWESHTPTEVNDWLTDDERVTLNAYKHLRDSAAHRYDGGRANFQSRRTAFETKMPFSGITWDQGTDSIDLSNSRASLDCYNFMERVTKQLIVRLHKNEKP